MSQEDNEKRAPAEVLMSFGSVSRGSRRIDFVKVRTISGRVLYGLKLYKNEAYIKQLLFDPEIKTDLISLLEKGKIESHELKQPGRGKK